MGSNTTTYDNSHLNQCNLQEIIATYVSVDRENYSYIIALHMSQP